jgi:hypothetical protein
LGARRPGAAACGSCLDASVVCDLAVAALSLYQSPAVAGVSLERFLIPIHTSGSSRVNQTLFCGQHAWRLIIYPGYPRSNLLGIDCCRFVVILLDVYCGFFCTQAFSSGVVLWPWTVCGPLATTRQVIVGAELSIYPQMKGTEAKSALSIESSVAYRP